MRSPLQFSFSKQRVLIVFALLAVAAISAFAYTKARSPKPEELVGVWIGFDSDELNFTRLDLRPDFTGYCARVSPADTTLHQYGTDSYRVTKWTMDDWKFIINLTPSSIKAESIYLRGRFNGFSLRLEVGGTNGEWKRDLVLYREARVDASNREAKQKIGEQEKK